MNRTLVCAGAAAGAFVLAAGAFAAAGAKSPKLLVLQKADVPSGATRQPLGAVVAGATAKVFTVTFNFRNGAREEEVTNLVASASSAANAETEYRLHVGGETGFKGDTVLRLPAYGDEQYADFNPARARGELIVRKGNVVWTLTVENCSTLSPYGCVGGTTPPKMTKAQALSELKRYAPKEKARVGGG